MACCVSANHRPPANEPALRRCPACHGRGWIGADTPMAAMCHPERDAVVVIESEGLALCTRCSLARLDAEFAARDARQHAGVTE